MIIVTITSVTSFAGQRCLTQLWVCILAGGPFVATFITTSYKAETHETHVIVYSCVMSVKTKDIEYSRQDLSPSSFFSRYFLATPTLDGMEY